MVQFLIENALCDKNEVNARNSTALHEASLMDKSEMVKYLLSQGLDVDAVDFDGRTPLLRSMSGAMALILIDHGADVNAVGEYWRTPAHKAVGLLYRAKVDSVDLLRVLGASGANLAAGSEVTPAGMAEDCGLIDVAIWLRHVERYSPMQIACESRRPDLIRRFRVLSFHSLYCFVMVRPG